MANSIYEKPFFYSMNNLISEHYETFWNSFSRKNDVYERDEVFPSIFKEGDKVLDLACGDGTSSLKISQITQSKVYGLELSKKATSLAKEKGILVKMGSVEDKFPFESELFDVVFWGDNIEHIFSPESAIRETYRVLKKGGRLIVSTPNTSYWRYRLYYLIHGCLSDTEFDNNPVWRWSHIRFFNIKLLTEFVNSYGFTLKRVFGVNKRKLDNILCRVFPDLFGMIIVIEAKKI